MTDFIRWFDEATASLKLASLVGYVILWVCLVMGRWP